MEDYMLDWEREREARYEARARLLPVKEIVLPPADLKPQFITEARVHVFILNKQLSRLCGSAQVSCDLTQEQLYSYARSLQFEEDRRAAEKLMDLQVVEYTGKAPLPTHRKRKH